VKDLGIRGQDACATGTPPKRYPAGRRCEREGCGTVLSIYNRTAWCWQHDPAKHRRIERRVLLLDEAPHILLEEADRMVERLILQSSRT
jgi:hypothetical protein